MSTGRPNEPAAARVEVRVVLTTPENDPASLAREARQDAAAARRANRRTHRRLGAADFRWLRAARVKYGQRVHVIDISAGGMLIETEQALPCDSKMVLELAGPERAMLAACRVLRCEAAGEGGTGRFRIACAFVRPLDLPDLIDDTQLTRSVASGIVAGLDALGGRRENNPGAERGRLHSTPQAAAASARPIATGWQKVIVRYRDGQLLRGYTNNFHIDRPLMHLSEQPCRGKPVMVPLSRLKALFFVREFDGDPRQVDRPEFDGSPAGGRKVEVTFHDGEVLVGSTVSYRRDGNGFFVQPADPRSNNLRVFVILEAIQRLRFL